MIFCFRKYKSVLRANFKFRKTGDALGRFAAERPECALPSEQALENAQNGKGLAIG
jgi:hypothetical protein